MNIKHENVPGQLQQVVFEIVKEDYQPAVEAALKKQRRTANVPGFRTGMAPMGMIKKMYGTTILVQEVDRLVNSSMDQFMTDNKIKFIFEPLPIEEQSTVDFSNPDKFVFAYEYALAPEVNVDFAKLPAVVDFKIIPTDDERGAYIKQLRERHGNYVTPETIEDNDSLSVSYGDDQDGFFFMRDLSEDAIKKFEGKKVGDAVTLALRKAFNNEMTLARFLKTDKEKLEADNEYKYKVTIKHIGRIEPAELNEEFFKKAFADGSVNNEAELNAQADKVVLEQYQPELNRQFMNDAIEMLIDNVAVEVPDDFVKRYIVAVQKDMTMETVEEKYAEYKRAFQWQIIEGELLENSDIKVEQDDVKNYFRQYFVKNYFNNFNAEDVKDRIEELVNQAMGNKEYVKNVYDLLFDEKLTEYLRANIKIDHKEGDVKAFVDMLTAREAAKNGAEEKPAPKKRAACKKKADKEEGPAAEAETDAAPAPARKCRTKAAKTAKEE